MTNIGRLLNSLLAQERVQKAKEERPQERYARIDIALDDVDYVGTDIEIHITGDYVGRIKYDGSATGCYFKLNNRHSGRIYAGEFRRTYAEFNRIYLTNPSSQAGKHLILVIGGAFSGEIEPSSGGKTGIQDSGGTDIDPAQAYCEDAAHNSGDKGVQILAVRKSTPIDLSSADGDYEPLQIDEGNLWVKTEIDAGGELQEIKEDLEAIQTLQGIDGMGDLQKVKEELEKILLDTAAIELLQGIDGGGELQKIKEELEKILLDTAAIELLQGIDGGGDLQKVKEELEAISTLQGVDGTGDLQKVKEELEKILLDTAAIELLQGIDGGGDLQQVKEELEAILTLFGLATHEEDTAHATTDLGVQILAVRKSTPIDLSSADGDYEPLQIDEGNLWVKTEIDAGGELQEIKEDLEAIQTLQGIDGLGDLQKVKEELEKVNTDLAALEVLQGVDGAGDLQNIKEDLEAIQTLQGIDGAGDLQKVKEAVEVGTLIAGTKSFDIANGEVNFDAQAVARHIDIIVSDMGDATWIVIGTTGTPTIGVKLTAVGQGIQHLPISNANLVKMDTDATSGNDVTVAYIGV